MIGLAGRNRRSRHRYTGLLVACLISVAHFASFDITGPIITDVRYYLYFALRITQGAIPHLDFFDNKTQLSSIVGALMIEIGTLVGLDALSAIRVGYLALAAAAAVLQFEIHRRLGNGRVGAGLLALAPCTGFALLGLLPSIGNTPKLLTALFASVAALSAHDRRWLAAGAAGWLAFMDWQVGLLVLAATAAAALSESEHRITSLARALMGALVAATPFFVCFGLAGALGAAWRQTILASLARGSASLARRGTLERLQHLGATIRDGCSGHSWLVGVAVVGMPILALWIWRHRRRPTLRLLILLAFYHYGVVAFSLFDFQGYGDLFILLHSLAFFASVAFVEALLWLRLGVLKIGRWRRRQPSPLSASFATWSTVCLLLLAVRPSFMRSEFVLTPLGGPPAEVTLEDQWQVARKLEPLINGKRVVVLGYAELPFLLERSTDVPFLYWNRATLAYYRLAPDENAAQALRRKIDESTPGVIVLNTRVWAGPNEGPAFREVTLRSANGVYEVTALVRQ